MPVLFGDQLYTVMVVDIFYKGHLDECLTIDETRKNGMDEKRSLISTRSLLSVERKTDCQQSVKGLTRLMINFRKEKISVVCQYIPHKRWLTLENQDITSTTKE